MIIPPERFRDEELFDTKEELEKIGHKTTIASTHLGLCPGSRGRSVKSELDISKLNTNNFDAVVFVGGGGSKLLFNNENAINIAKDLYEHGKIVAAICLAPVILANAGLLKGRNATVAGTEARTIESKGAKYIEPGIVTDGNIVTANAPKKSRLFGQTIGLLLKEKNNTKQ
jgi:protease I